MVSSSLDRAVYQTTTLRDQDVSLLRSRPEVRPGSGVFRSRLVRRGDAKERRLGKRPSDEHDPDRKFCRNGPHEARTITRLVGPIPAKLSVGIMFVGRPFAGMGP